MRIGKTLGYANSRDQLHEKIEETVAMVSRDGGALQIVVTPLPLQPGGLRFLSLVYAVQRKAR